MVDFVTLSLVKEFAKCVIMQLKMSFIFYVFVLYTKILKRKIDFIALSNDPKLVYMLKQPIRNLIKYVTLAWNLRKTKLVY